METKEKSREIAAALVQKVLVDIGRQIVTRNREASALKRLARQRYLARVLTVNLGGFNNEGRNNN